MIIHEFDPVTKAKMTIENGLNKDFLDEKYKLVLKKPIKRKYTYTPEKLQEIAQKRREGAARRREKIKELVNSGMTTDEAKLSLRRPRTNTFYEFSEEEKQNFLNSINLNNPDYEGCKLMIRKKGQVVLSPEEKKVRRDRIINFNKYIKKSKKNILLNEDQDSDKTEQGQIQEVSGGSDNGEQEG